MIFLKWFFNYKLFNPLSAIGANIHQVIMLTETMALRGLIHMERFERKCVHYLQDEGGEDWEDEDDTENGDGLDDLLNYGSSSNYIG